MIAKKHKPKTLSTRPYKTDYAGTWCGYCATRESAIVAGVKHMLKEMANSCTITGPEGDVARLRRHRDGKGVDITTEKILPVRKAVLRRVK